MSKYKYHDIANIYPMAQLDEFELLKQSLRDRGQEMPIVLYEGKILDGRNRYKACNELGIEPVYREFEGTYDDALDYSIELNSGRRNLDKSQKAMTAAYSIEKSRLDGSNKIKIKDAVRIYSVSDRYIKDALYILDNNEKIAQQVFDGLETITKARKRVDEVNGKLLDIEYIERYSEAQIEDSELSDAYSYLHSLDKRQLVGIIIKNDYLKKGN
ncbi:MAG TPA: ParB/RepB/Spo0J family partition protein [Sulfurovum sp.]